MMRINELLRRRDEDGFTLIELMVVVLIIGILIAIAIPTFLGARQRAQDRAAQSSLRNALTNAKAIYTDHEDYSNATAASLASAEPSLTFLEATAGSSTGPTNISVSEGAVGSTTWAAAALSKSGKCFYLKDSTNGPGTQFGTGDGTTCKGSDVPNVTAYQSGGW